MGGKFESKLFFVILFFSAICLSWNIFHSDLNGRKAKYLHNSNIHVGITSMSSIILGSTGMSAHDKRQVEVIQAKRQVILRNACKRLGLERSIPEDDEKFNRLIKNTYLFYSDKHKLIACVLFKCGSTNLKRVFVTAEDVLNVSEPDKIKAFDANRMSRELLLKRVSNVTEIRTRMQNYFKFIMVRDPFTRLLSAYRDKIENPPAVRFKKTSKEIHQIVTNTTEAAEISATFLEFVRYISDHSHKNDPHWDLFHRLCSPCTIEYDFIAHLETMNDDIPYVMDEVNMKNIKFPTGYPQDARTDDEKLTKYFKNFPTDVIKNLYNMYKVDYELFGYASPLK